MTKTDKRAAEENLVVAFQGVSFGDKTARVGVKIDREIMAVGDADELFCDRRLEGQIVLGHTEDAATQKELFEAAHKVNGVFDVKGYRVTAKDITIGLTFSVGEIDRGELASFAKSGGRLLIFSHEEIPDEPPHSDTPPDSPAAAGAADDGEDDDADDEEFAEVEPEEIEA